MHDGESVEAFLRRVAELRAELSALGEPVDDKLLVPLTLRALPSRVSDTDHHVDNHSTGGEFCNPGELSPAGRSHAKCTRSLRRQGSHHEAKT
ncbi:hypothetical protein KI387_044193 [Taxus chinensis]|uniref:Uncharacterized protein n=1 Tax=Taxus chinensis TaxID=29808 RepID=A0AA38KVN3_TAXCH|nr:hypothetical protein KI387_044193 [Taxus chinensis]